MCGVSLRVCGLLFRASLCKISFVSAQVITCVCGVSARAVVSTFIFSCVCERECTCVKERVGAKYNGGTTG